MNRISCEKMRENAIEDRNGLNTLPIGFVQALKQLESNFPLFPAPMRTMNKLYCGPKRAKRGWIASGFKRTRQMRSP